MSTTNKVHQVLSRRRFLLTTAAGVSMIALTSLLSACGSDDDDAEAAGGASTATPSSDNAPAEPTSTTPSEAGSPTPSTGSNQYTYAPETAIERAELVVGVQGLPAVIDPAIGMGNVGTHVSYTPYDTLIRRDFLNDNEHVPSLALSWERINDTVLELKLREDVTFHNGDPFTADDVVFTFERLMNAEPDSALTQAQTYFSTFAKIETLDDYTVRIETTGPDPLIIKRLASWASWIVPKAHIEEVDEEEFILTGMGTGPFKFVSFDPDNELVLERYNDYWGDSVSLERLVFRVIPEIAARVTALLNDEVQITTNVPPDQAASIGDAEDVEARIVPLSNTHVLIYNTKNPALDDKKLRQALNLGIDRQLIIDTIWSGQDHSA